MEVDAQAQLPPDADRAVLATRFVDDARVAIAGALSGGFSGARVLKITPYRDGGTPEQPDAGGADGDGGAGVGERGNR